MHQEFWMKSVNVAACTLDLECRWSTQPGEELNGALPVTSALSHHLGLDEGKASYKAGLMSSYACLLMNKRNVSVTLNDKLQIFSIFVPCRFRYPSQVFRNCPPFATLTVTVIYVSFFFLPSYLSNSVESTPHLEGSSLSLSFQDVALQILWGAQWSGDWTTTCTVQTALFCELHHILLWGSGQMWNRVQNMEC